jgi:alkanesulfonate monooxygenase SsuD/methylene tetrahydromethanopterin reductase-like flavin-dependent oxidoreductase (luciferase family)
MRIGVSLPAHYAEGGGLAVAARARLAESLGFDDLWVPDHVMFRMPMGDVHVLAALAIGATERILVCTGVVQAGLRHPMVLAKLLGTLSLEAPGRVVAGLGVGGDYREEWHALGIDPSTRGARFEEVLDTLPALMRNEPVHHDGEHFRFDAVPLFGTVPPPVPVWIGARETTASRRALRADGWLGMLRRPDEFAAVRRQLLDEAVVAGRPPIGTGMALVASVGGTDGEARARCADFFRRSYGLPPERGERRAIGGVAQLTDQIAGFREAGADRLSITLVDEPEAAWPLVAEALAT